jgi:hypothetical protein
MAVLACGGRLFEVDRQCAFGMSRAIWAAKRVTARGVGSTCGPYPLRWTPGLAARFVGRARNGFDTPRIYAGVQGAVVSIHGCTPPAIGGGSRVLLAACGPGSLVWGVNRSGERGRERVELGLEAGAVGAGSAALHEVPDRVSSQFAGLLDFRGLGGLDGSGGKAVLAGAGRVRRGGGCGRTGRIQGGIRGVAGAGCRRR